MLQAITQRIRGGTDGAAGAPPVPVPAGAARTTPRSTVLDAECECPDECLRDHENE